MWEPFAKVGEITLYTLSSFEITPNDVDYRRVSYLTTLYKKMIEYSEFLCSVSFLEW